MGHVKRRRGRRGSAIVEVSLMVPWILFLFVGILDFGFYSYAAIATQNAARAAAIVSSNTSFVGSACQAALGELRVLPNMPSVTSCVTAPANITDAAPLAVEPPVILSCTSTPPCVDCTSAACAKANTPRAVSVSVTYQTLPMVPIPGLLTGRLTLTRTAEMRMLE